MSVLKKMVGVVSLAFLTCLAAGGASWAADALKSVRDRGTLVRLGKARYNGKKRRSDHH